ncbi:MAG: tetratricopeptide repeat protein [bacterium]
MSATERWKQVREIFDAVADLPPAERAAEIARACGADAALRAEVEALLVADGAPAPLLKREASELGAALFSEIAAGEISDERFVGMRIGNYKILRKLGEGGMGIVFEAEQETPRRLVALKVIRGGAFVDDARIRLFQREAQSLALLKHPSIAAIYEAGRTSDGQHFFAMEHVHGEALDVYLRGRAAHFGQRDEILLRLRIFLKICEAIGYAHQRGVIHRDLKPSNILVMSAPGAPIAPGATTSGSTAAAASTAFASSSTSSAFSANAPAVKVLDFGLARITDADVTLAATATRSGHVQGTLAYMSPEQARGNSSDIDVRTDVYALGMLLYEMLVGKLPYDVSKAMLHESVRVICEEEPARPSVVQRALRGDLETIVLKALEKEPARRYQTAVALAEDIERYITNQPIAARPASTVYQVRKLVARNKGLASVVAGTFVLLLAFGITMAFMAGQQRAERLRADAQRARAEQEAETARRTTLFVQEMLGAVDPLRAQGKDVTVREVLDEASARMETELADQPEVAASIRLTIGNTYDALGLYDDAASHLRAALETRRTVFGNESEEVAVILHDLGSHMLNRAEYDSSRALFQESVDIRRRLFGETKPEIALGMSNLASIMAETGDLDGADSLWTITLAMQRKLLGNEDSEIAVTLTNLAAILHQKGDLDRAEPLLKEGLAMRRKLLGNDHPNVALGVSGLAALLKDKGDYDGAEVLFREVLAGQRKSYGDEHPHIARTLMSLAVVLSGKGDYEESEALHREALAMHRKLLGAEHPDVARSLSNLAGLLSRKGDTAGAITMHRESLAMRRKSLGVEHPDVAASLNALAGLLDFDGDHRAAEPLFREALAIRRKALGDDHPDVAESLTGLGTLLTDSGRAAEGEALLREALAKMRAARAPGHWRIARVESDLGACMLALERLAEAESLLVGSQAVLEAAAGPSPRQKERARERVALLYERSGRGALAAEVRAAR